MHHHRLSPFERGVVERKMENEERKGREKEVAVRVMQHGTFAGVPMEVLAGLWGGWDQFSRA